MNTNLSKYRCYFDIARGYIPKACRHLTQVKLHKEKGNLGVSGW